MQEETYRKSAVGGGIGGFVFLLLGLYLNRAIGAGVLDHPGPVAVLVVIGATVGALVAPLVPSRGDGEERGEKGGD